MSAKNAFLEGIMSLQVVDTLATFGTFLVIAATAIAAVIQLRHARSSNAIAALNELRETMETADFQEAQHFVVAELPERAEDPAFRYQFAQPSARTDEMRPLIRKANTIGNFFEAMGLLVKAGLVDRDLTLEQWSAVIVDNWDALADVIPITRRKQGDSVWENFEYLTVLSLDFQAAHAKGTYPPGVRRIVLKDRWLETDKQYAASLAQA
jgi:Domain of unknown function (DUF4760)